MNRRRRPRKKKPKKINSILKVILLLFVVVIIITIYKSSKISISIEETNTKLNEMMTLEINVKKYDKYISMDSLEINLQHKYKKDEKLTTKITPYADGRYKLYYYPQIQGEYLIDVTAEKKGETFYKNDTIKVG